jgi:outer membrane receptor protein involved in Fe transport
VAAGARNLFDRNYALAVGFPQEGRSFTLSIRLRT